MRHGRKSKSKRFNGFKRHIAADVDRGLILACAITPANRPEDEAMPFLTVDLERQGLVVDYLLIERGTSPQRARRTLSIRARIETMRNQQQTC